MAKQGRWFDRAVAALDLLSAEMGVRPAGGYVCPLCTRVFPAGSMNLLSREHVPPASIGGRRICLTCRDCNSRFGHDLDDEVKAMQNIIDLANGRPIKEMRARVQVDDARLNTVLQRDGAAIDGSALKLDAPSGANSQDSENAFKEVFSANRPGRQIIMEVDGFSFDRAKVGWLRVAYLAAFTALGYRYIFMDEVDKVRQQILEPDRKLILPFYLFRPEDDEQPPRIGFVTSPIELVSVIVGIGPHLVFLPWIETPGIYERLGMISERTSFAVQLHEWPTGPMHLLDRPIRELDPSGQWSFTLVSSPSA